MKIIVTGATGFIGHNIVHELDKEHEVIATGTENEQEVSIKGKLVMKPFYEFDWDTVDEIDAVCHQAAICDTRVMDEELINFVNAEASANFFEAAIKKGAKIIVYASSTSVYGRNPPPYMESHKLNALNPYGKSKVLQEELVTELQKKYPEVIFVGLRYANVYGPGEGHKDKMANMIYQLAQQMKTGNPKLFKHGEQKRDQVYVKDVVRANKLALQAQKSGIYNCATGTAVTFNQIIKLLNQQMGTDKEVEYIDNPYESFFQNFTQCDMSLAKEELGYEPEYDIESGIADYLASGRLTE
jgi:ADP-L-glycero-D-manno-heptose 6-epimerase